ncbi:formimidoylglutamase (plasmid) [Natrialba magadii ATCC 43099]|uniref:Formimidoylglutamase n=1 Tax=Natrialba magadii (strain ATCC 43099 / DSM 3394 / CCM 3739 / CIP 104546 / IAM 13178 / JCM 8861 / NBRC 102185 / NCIMB 2190 / MS3) TaxID=547559 RepID=D3T1B7_NATMM|nr:formimidoylglutamase [Natrialba magadii]ADD07376.1 formimidoylglutamase [Natrialba magadii ATCC 43099]ELY32446.1 formiminoglutamase [Natrialba magadii ATCC 43099]
MQTTSSNIEWASRSSDPTDETFGELVEPVATDDLDSVKAVLVGEPFDAAVIGRTGASEGPDAIRDSLAGAKTHHFDAGPCSALQVGDYGNVSLATAETGTPAATDDTELTTIRSAVEPVARAVHDSSATPIFLGGDNSLTVPNVRPLLERGDAVGVINLDAHLDVRHVHDGPTSGTPYRELLESGLDTYTCVGARHFETSTAYASFLEGQGGEIVTAASVGSDLDGAVSRVLESVADVDTVYLSIDCDVLDAVHAPGVSAPTPGGLTTRELFELVRRVASHDTDRLAGVEIVECAPPLDEGQRTVTAAARTVAHALVGLVQASGGELR